MTSVTPTSSARPASVLGRFGLPLLLAAFVLLGAIYAIVTPLFEISDELWHYPMVKTLADGDGLPVQDPANPGPWRQEGSQPPLYYAVMALATSWIDTSDLPEVRWVNPHADNGIITADRNNNIVIHTGRENGPWTGTVLAVRLIRLLSVLLGAVTVYCTYRLALEVYPDRPGPALAAAGFVAFTPMFVFISASVNNDNLAITLSAASLWLMVRWLRAPAPPRRREIIVMGLLLGGGALSKVSVLGLWLLAGVALLAGELLQRRPALREWPRVLLPRLGQGVVMAAVAVLVSGWWFARNLALYGDVLGWNAFLATVGERPHPATLLQLWGERAGFVQAYWGLFGGVSVPLPAWTYTALTLMAGVALLGALAAALLALRRWRTLSLPSVASWSLLLGWLVLIVVGLLRWSSLTWASQGRLIFPAIGVVSLLWAVGLDRLWRRLPAMAVAGMALLTMVVPFTVIVPAYAPPPGLSAADIAAITHPLPAGGASFGGEMRLLGYDLTVDTAQPGQALRLTLYWQSQIAMDRNWSIFVHVVDDAGVILAQRDRYPGQGTLATTLLAAGETWADSYVIPIPDVAYAPVSATLEVGLYDLADGARPLLPDGSDALTLTPVTIAARPVFTAAEIGEVPNPFGQNFANQIELVGYSYDRRAVRAGETLRVTLYWRALQPVPVNYSVFVHVRGLGETLWGGADAWPQAGAAPTAAWKVGDIIADSYEITVKPDTPPGQYDIEVGLYAAAGVRLQALADDGRPTDLDFVFLSRIQVTP